MATSDDTYGFQEAPSPQPEKEDSSQPQPEREAVQQSQLESQGGQAADGPVACEDTNAPAKKEEATAPSVPRRDVVPHLAVFGIAAVCIAIVLATQMSKTSDTGAAERAAFENVDALLFSPVKQTKPGTPPAKVGKIVLVDMNKRAFDPLHLEIPAFLRAKEPKEVATIGQLTYQRQFVGRFEKGGLAIHLVGTMTVIDRETRTVITTRAFTWGKAVAPTSSSEVRREITGPPPVDEITKFLTELR